ncbi:trypsin-like serine protease [Bdellovibrio sp. 22V]|uniref:S1 family peptidase n=1 Tax=Bdellovibrio TaxID=958 RepID=UPI0025439FA8|nr:trypsin-like serine protease [Bdellovibrio sp. 22V]WII72454.1 trypsin-like serine protease [Bdellovibrio sp. 22V]
MKNVFIVAMTALLATACAPTSSVDSITTSEAQNSIVGGDKVQSSSLIGRSTVGIYEPNIGYICSGTLIAKNLVLTAGHCVDPKAKNLVVMFAPEMRKAAKEQIRAVTNAIVHPDYSTEIREKDMYDIAILRFEGEAPAGFQVAPMLFSSEYLQNNGRTIVAGYGLSWTIGLKAGAGTLRTTTLEIDEVDYSSTEVMLGQSVRRGICSGDSGGPAYLQINGQLHVWGVASRGDSLPGFLTPKCMLFSIFTRVGAHQTWIQDTMAELAK